MKAIITTLMLVINLVSINANALMYNDPSYSPAKMYYLNPPQKFNVTLYKGYDFDDAGNLTSSGISKTQRLGQEMVDFGWSYCAARGRELIRVYAQQAGSVLTSAPKVALTVYYVVPQVYCAGINIDWR